MRRFLIAGNWKMNCGPSETRSLLRGLRERLPVLPEGVDVLVCPPSVSLAAASEELEGYEGAALGGQNMHFEENGAYTGEISGPMLREAGCTWVIAGHSERRALFAETDPDVNRKVHSALSAGLKPVICVGESLPQRTSGSFEKVVRKQVEAAFEGVEAGEAAQVTVAYEPVWAIGTGETATPEQAQQMHAMIRSVAAERYTAHTAQAMRILYGGSMKPQNAEELLAQPDVDGGLIGGASLDAGSFAEIISIASGLAS